MTYNFAKPESQVKENLNLGQNRMSHLLSRVMLITVLLCVFWKSLDFKIYVCFLNCGRFWRFFFWLTFCFLDKTEKLKTGGCVEAVVVSFGEVKIEGRTVTESEV